MKPTLLLLAAGMGSRYGGLKQLDGLGLMVRLLWTTVSTMLFRLVLVRSFSLSARISRISSARKSSLSTRAISQQSFASSLWMHSLKDSAYQRVARSHGTNHAVLMAKDVIKEPFCVINCDDFYNRDCFMVIGKFLSELPEGSTNKYAMVGFRVGNTLSENGTVARGICSKDENENLTTCVERTEIMRINGEVSYKDEEGKWVAVGDNTPVSMNVWGFTPDYFAHSEAYFKEFLSDPKNMENKKAEFFIPLMVNKLINEGTSTVKVLDTTSKWFGVTYAADRQSVVDRIQGLIDEGVYPNKLF